MTAVFGTIIFVLALILILGTILFVVRALRSRSQSTRQAYGVGQQEARLAMQRNLLWGFIALVFGLLFLGAFFLGSRLEAFTPEPTATPLPTVVAEPTAVSEPTALPTETPELIILSSPTSIVVPAVTNTAVPTPTNTPEPESTTALVSSGVGVWLRSAPGLDSEQLEYLVDGTLLTLLEEQQPADDLLWQSVASPTGATGWVAVDFIVPTSP